MTEVLGLLVGIFGGAIALALIGLLGGLFYGAVRGIWSAGWPDKLLVGVSAAWGIATVMLVASLPVVFAAWIMGAREVGAVAGQIAGYCLWPAVLGFPLFLWLVSIFDRRG